MLSLVRSSSFSRRSKGSHRAPTDPMGSHNENSENAATAKPSTMKKIVRSASFGRKNRQQQQQQAATPAAAPPSQESTDIDDSMSRSATPDTDRSPNSPEEQDARMAAAESRMAAAQINLAEYEAETGGMEPQLYGWLKKRSQKGSWNKRYFFVDEQRGTMGYSKGVKGRSAKPSAILPLADVTRMEPLDEEKLPCAFKISCPPIHLTVMAVSVKERKRWMRQIELRTEVWKQKQREKMPVADVHAMLREASHSAANVATNQKKFPSDDNNRHNRRNDNDEEEVDAQYVMGIDVSDEPPITSGVSRVAKWDKRAKNKKGGGGGGLWSPEADADDEDDGAGVGVTRSMPSPAAFKAGRAGLGGGGGGSAAATAGGGGADMQPRSATVEYIAGSKKGSSSHGNDKKAAARSGNGDEEDERAEEEEEEEESENGGNNNNNGCLDISDGLSSLSPASAAAAPAATSKASKLSSRVGPPAPLEVPGDKEGGTPSNERATRKKGRSPGKRQQQQGGNGGETVCETVELYSEDDEESDDGEGKVNSANKASGGRHSANGKARGRSPNFRGTGPVPLAAMMSSDEEDEEDEMDAIPSLASSLNASVGRSAAAALAAAKEEAVVVVAAPAAEEEEEAAVVREEPKRMRKKLTGGFDDSDDEDDAKKGAAAPMYEDEEVEAPFARPAPRRAAGGVAEYVEAPKIQTDTATAAEADWDTDEEDEEDENEKAVAQMRPGSSSSSSSSSRPVVVETVAGEAAPAGIVADDNFAEEDWDDEDM